MSAEIIEMNRFMESPQFAIESEVSSLQCTVDHLHNLQVDNPKIIAGELENLQEAARKLNSLIFRIRVNKTFRRY